MNTFARALMTVIAFALVATVTPPSATAPVSAASSAGTERNETLRQRMFSTQVLVTMRENQVRNAYVSMYMMAWMLDHPNATANEVDYAMKGVMNTWNEAEYDTTGSGLAKTASALSSVLGLVKVGGAEALQKLGSVALEKGISQYEQSAQWKKNAAGDRLAADLMQVLLPYRREVYEKVADFAKVKPAFGEAWDRNIGWQMGVSSRATLEEIELDPNVTRTLDIRQITNIDFTNDPEAFEAEVMKQTRSVLRKQQTQVEVAMTGLSDLKLREHVSLTEYAPPIDTAAYAEIVSDKVNWDQVLDDSYAALSVLSHLAGWVDPNFGRKLEIAARATYQIGKAISDFIPAAASLGMNVLTNVATANMLGAVMAGISALMPLFLDSGPTGLEAVIIAMRDMVSKLGEEMHARFDSIDNQLSVIYADMMDQFDEVIRLGRINNEQLYQVNLQISALSSQLDGWGTEIFAALQEIALNDASTVLDGYVHYAANHNGAQIPNDRYVHDAEIPLHAALTQTITKAPFVGPVKADGTWREGQIEDALKIYKANGAIAYLDWYARQRFGWTGPTLGATPNPAAWLVLARGYEVLESENAASHKNVAPARATGVAALGKEILKANQSFSKPLSTPRANGTVTNQLFTGLINDYDAAIGKLNDQLRQTQKEFDDNHLYDIFGTPEQPVEKMSDPGEVRPCSPEGDKLNDPVALKRPPNVTLAKLPGLYVLASQKLDMTEAPKIYLCQDVEYVNDRLERRGRYDIYRYADVRISFKVRMEHKGIAKDLQTWAKIYPKVHDGCDYTQLTLPRRNDNPCRMSAYALAKNWEPYEGLPDREGTARWESGGWMDAFGECVPVAEDPHVYPQIRGQVVQFLAGRQNAYYTKVARELETGSSPLNKANQAVTKASTLLREYSRIGWANTLEHDDLMKMALFSDQRLPSDLGDDLMISRMFQTARDAYASCLPGPDGSCTSSPTEYDPMKGQSLPAACPTDVPSAQRTADPVGNCLLGFGLGRSRVLKERYEQASKLIAAGTHAEDMPLISHAVARLEHTDTLVHIN
ncbi:hypothetical protein [Nonomuraea sp. NPDC050202]|uniref:hypothetical protein n=1 Tax=Nonomuraea sp. NPDC050202 TaxID=3155035 RepID=UPI0033DE7842